ncbi:T9SS type A sorting domain-containing protein, partial [bacterium]|nr:T9SS type A sorting domain-containing protein [bacterium]
IDNGMAIKFTTEAPDQADVWLAVDAQTIDDSTGGDGDGVAEPTETFDLILTLINSGASTASGVTGTISTTDPDLIIVDGSADFGSIAGSASGDNAASPFVVTVSGSPADETAELDLHIYSGSRYDAYDIVTITIDLTGTGVEDPEIPLAFALRQNYPNPFRGGTALAFALPRPAEAKLDIYNVAGRRIATVVSGNLPAGNHLVTWDGTDTRGAKVPAGIYFYRFEADGFESTRKMILLK